MNKAKLEQLQKMSAQVRTGGKGSVRRKKKAVHRNAGTDAKQLQGTFKRLGMTNIPGIEEANMFKDDGSVLHFTNPKVQASLSANTYAITGTGETKSLQELFPGIIQQLGPDNLASLKRLAESYSAEGAAAAAAAGAGTGVSQDDDVPELVENFEEAAKE